MKEQNIRVVEATVSTVVISETPRHFFKTAQGTFCAVMADNLPKPPAPPNEKPLSKGDKLKILMDCDDRLYARYQAFFSAYEAESSESKKNALWTKVKAVNKALNRVSKKIADLLASVS